jgi:hypothetical protein
MVFCIHAQGRSPKAAALIISGMTHYPQEALDYVATCRNLVDWEPWKNYLGAHDHVKFAHKIMQGLFMETSLTVAQKYWVSLRNFKKWICSASTDIAACRIILFTLFGI